MISLLLVAMILRAAISTPEATPAGDVLEQVERKMVKIYGQGGVGRLEGYQTGVAIGEGRVLTVDSIVLDRGVATIVDAYGDRSEAQFVGRDASTGLALLALPKQVEPPAFASLDAATPARRGQSVWVLSNCFKIAAGEEPISVQRCRVAAEAPIPLGSSQAASPPIGVPVLGTRVVLLDGVTSNPGAAGGAVFDSKGQLLAILGAECRSTLTGAWINYALPVDAAAAAVDRIARGEDLQLSTQSQPQAIGWRGELRAWGLVFLPRLSDRTPAYIEWVDPESPAAQAGLRSDDLVVSVNGVTVATTEEAGVAIDQALLTSGSSAKLTVVRDRQMLSIELATEAP